MKWHCFLCHSDVLEFGMVGGRQQGRCIKCNMVASRRCTCHDVIKSECPIHAFRITPEKTREAPPLPV
jgi:hypothetical protein